jgi:hypothetical protein
MRIHATISLLSWTYGHCTGSDSVGTYISRAASWGEQLRNTTTTSTHWPSAMGLEEVTVRGGPEHCDARTWTNLLRIISPRPGCRYWQLQLIARQSHLCGNCTRSTLDSHALLHCEIQWLGGRHSHKQSFPKGKGRYVRTALEVCGQQHSRATLAQCEARTPGQAGGPSPTPHHPREARGPDHHQGQA